jgi:hypothetical protein
MLLLSLREVGLLVRKEDGGTFPSDIQVRVTQSYKDAL